MGAPDASILGGCIRCSAWKATLHLRGPRFDAVPLLTVLHVATPVKARVARPLIEGLRNETIVQDDRIRELVPLALTPFDTAAQAAFRKPE